MSHTKYDERFTRDPKACGEPHPEMLAELGRLTPPARLLDLGCGQGRDALAAARMGHSVIAVDLSSVGIDQLNAAATAEGLNIAATVHDVVHFEPPGDFDAVLVDRVLHMLPDDEARRAVLTRAIAATRPGGSILTADTPTHVPLILRFFEEAASKWTVRMPAKGLQFFTSPSSSS